VDNSVSSTGYSSNEYACDNTNDKVFVLSYLEASNATYKNKKVLNITFKRTDYAACMGCWQRWWLRSPFYYASDFVRRNGDTASAYDTRNGVVPALYLQE